MCLFLIFSQGEVSKANGDPAQPGQSSDRGSPATLTVKSSSRSGLASVAQLVKLGRCKNIVVVAGAGISTASGIPDFRLVLCSLFAGV